MTDYIRPSEVERIRQSLEGLHGPDQKRIAVIGLQILHLLLQKNQDYGSSAWKAPLLAPTLGPAEAIQCRMSDKVARLNHLLAGNAPNVQESARETMTDLVGYGVLWLALPPDAAERKQYPN